MTNGLSLRPLWAGGAMTSQDDRRTTAREHSQQRAKPRETGSFRETCCDVTSFSGCCHASSCVFPKGAEVWNAARIHFQTPSKAAIPAAAAAAANRQLITVMGELEVELVQTNDWLVTSHMLMQLLLHEWCTGAAPADETWSGPVCKYQTAGSPTCRRSEQHR